MTITNHKAKAVKYIVLLLIAIFATSCSKKSSKDKPLAHGVRHTAERSAVWVTLKGETAFIMTFDRAELVMQNENWDDGDFNVYYELSSSFGKTRLLIYGGLDRGVTTAAYNNDPLNLASSTFFADRDDKVVALAPSEKDKWIDKIKNAADEPAAVKEPESDDDEDEEYSGDDEFAESEDEGEGLGELVSPGGLRYLTGDDMDKLREERSDAIEQGSPLGEEHDAVGEFLKSRGE